jgi:exonuclease III
MKGLFWNIRGLNQSGKKLSLGNLIRGEIDFIGIQETKKEELLPSFLRNLTTPAIFSWHVLPTKKTTGGSY